MASGLPPPPVNDKPGSFAWLEWYRQLRNYVSTSGSVPWYIINFQGSNITDIALRDHNQMQNTQGGSSNQKYHLTQAQLVDVTSISDIQTDVSSLQTDVSGIESQLSAGFTGTIATAKLTPGGANGSMTFTNGILTAQTPAT